MKKWKIINEKMLKKVKYILKDSNSLTMKYSMIWREKKGKGEKEHEKPNLNKSVYFISEDFKCDENDFKI